MVEPKLHKDAIFRLLIQTRKGEKWVGKDWIYFNSHQVKYILTNLATLGFGKAIYKILKPTTDSLINSIFGLR